jgi:hypothetical protein
MNTAQSASFHCFCKKLLWLYNISVCPADDALSAVTDKNSKSAIQKHLTVQYEFHDCMKESEQ